MLSQTAVVYHKAKNPKRVGSLEKDKPISLRVKTLEWVEEGACTFFVNRRRVGMVKVMPFEAGGKTLKGTKAQESYVLILV